MEISEALGHTANHPVSNHLHRLKKALPKPEVCSHYFADSSFGALAPEHVQSCLYPQALLGLKASEYII